VKTGIISGVLLLLLTACVSVENTEDKKWEPRKRAEAHVNLGMDYLQYGEYETALSEFNLALAIDSKTDKAYHGKGLLAVAAGRTEKAESLFARAVQLNPLNFTAVNDYGIYLCENGQFEKGVRQLRRIESDPVNTSLTSTWLGLGICNLALNQDNLAKPYFRKVLAQAPTLPQALLPMAEISYNEKKFLSARGFLERYFSTGSISAEALYLGTKIETGLKDVSKAKQYARGLTQRYPRSPLTEKARALLH
jgi:type IV pilus assembly protein PilF